MTRSGTLQLTPLGDTDPFTPTPQRPVRVRARSMPVDTHFQPHRHAWAQLAYCAIGIVQVTVATPGEVTTYIVPPSRGVWIAPGARHSITVLEAAEFRTLYMDASATPAGWDGCRVIVISALVRELIQALDAPDGQPGKQDGAWAEAVHHKTRRRLHRTGHDKKDRHQKAQLGVADLEHVLEPGKQRGQQQLAEMADHVGQTDQPDDTRVLAKRGSHGQCGGA